MGGKYGRAATPEELAEALEALVADDFLLLRQRAERLLWGTRYRDPNDLVHDAVQSALEGAKSTRREGRRWPLGVALLAFLTNAMKGIAQNDRVRKSTQQEVLATELLGDGADDDPDAVLAAVSGSHAPGVDLELIAAADAAELIRQRDQLFDWFRDDDEVTWMLIAMEDGHRGADIRTACGFTENQLEAAQTRLRRGKAKLIASRSKT
ncbi:MAG: hypothetical protein U1F54_04610 [Burkholderiales bacterium]